MKNFLLLILVIGLGITHAFSITTTAVTSGDWTDGGNWDNGTPGCFDSIVIPAGIQIDMTGNENLTACSPIVVYVAGVLYFNQGTQLNLSCGSYVYIESGGSIQANNYSNNGKKIDICGDNYWKGKDGQVSGPTVLGPSGLSIELLNFTANLRQNERVVDLNWVTVSEADNDYFTVERSADGLNWEAISTVDGAGTSSVELLYADIDPNPQFGVSYYRLKQTDFNGNYTYSPIVSIEMYAENQILIYPNPAENGTTINLKYVVVNFPEGFSGDTDVSIFSVDGKLIHQEWINVTETKQSLIKLDEKFSSGFYTIHTKFANTKLVVK
ncbi:MAG: T9SS type A sorting domain-containing protein [Crocinitomicaceae bacterium]